jgi:hypothetical protein
MSQGTSHVCPRLSIRNHGRPGTSFPKFGTVFRVGSVRQASCLSFAGLARTPRRLRHHIQETMYLVHYGMNACSADPIDGDSTGLWGRGFACPKRAQ